MPGGQQRLMQVRQSHGNLGSGSPASHHCHNDMPVSPRYLRDMFVYRLPHSHCSNVPAGTSHSAGKCSRPAKSRHSPRCPSGWLVSLVAPGVGELATEESLHPLCKAVKPGRIAA